MLSTVENPSDAARTSIRFVRADRTSCAGGHEATGSAGGWHRSQGGPQQRQRASASFVDSSIRPATVKVEQRKVRIEVGHADAHTTQATHEAEEASAAHGTNENLTVRI